LIWFDLFSRPVGTVLLGLLLAYLAYSFIADQRRDSDAAALHAAEGEVIEAHYGLFAGLLVALAGLVGVVLGARLLVDGGVVIARDLGISETIIGLTIVAVGTSLPELVTSIVAAYRGKSDVALGNVIGSNIFNVLGILGVTAVVHPFSVRGDIAAEAMSQGRGSSLISSEDIGALILSVFLLMLFAMTGKRIARWEGAILLLAYALYFGLLFDLIPVPGILPHA
jgi:cation:H+ antiporter